MNPDNNNIKIRNLITIPLEILSKRISYYTSCKMTFNGMSSFAERGSIPFIVIFPISFEEKLTNTLTFIILASKTVQELIWKFRI